jgi:hypothetical protein
MLGGGDGQHGLQQGTDAGEGFATADRDAVLADNPVGTAQNRQRRLTVEIESTKLTAIFKQEPVMEIR